MEAEIEQPLGEIHRRHAERFGLALEGDDEFVAGPPLRESRIEAGLAQFRHQIVGVQGGVFRDPTHAGAAEQAGVNIGAQDHPGVAHERRQAADALRPVGFGQPAIALAVLADDGNRQKRLQPGVDRHRTRAGTAAAVRSGEGLVQVHVHHVEAHVAGSGLAENGVEVGAVVVEQAAGRMDDGGDFGDVPLEHAQRRGIGQHQPGGLRPDRLAQGGEVHVAVGVGGDFPDREAAHDGGGGIGAVGGVGDQHFTAGVVAVGNMVGADHRHPGEFALRPGHRRQRDGLHPRDFPQHLLQLVQAGEKALTDRFRRQRMTDQEAGQRGQPVADPRVVLHGAGAQRIKVGVDGEILLRQPGVVAHRLEFRDFRQRRGPTAAQRFRNVGQGVSRRAGGNHRLPAGTGLVEYQHEEHRVRLVRMRRLKRVSEF